jgi:subtilisin family serine protease
MTPALAVAAVAAALAAPAQPVPPGKPAPETPAGHVPGELIVKFAPGLESGARARALRGRDARLERTLPVPRAALVRVPGGSDVRSAAAALERDPRVEWAEPNVYRYGDARPDDAFLPELWGLDNGGQAVNGDAGVADADIDAPEAWDRTTGSSGVKVAVLDSGIEFAQPDLAPNVWRNPGETGGGRERNGVDDDGNGYVDDWRGWDFVGRDNDPSDNYGHGTHVAGTIAARGNDGSGVAGVAWSASIIPVRVLDNDNAGTCADLAQGIDYAVRAGARVINASVSSYGSCRLEQEAIERAPDTLVVTTAGNDGEDTDQVGRYPCSLPSPNVVCVAATDQADRLPEWSGYGARSVDLAAPGVNTLSTTVKFGPTEIVYGTDFETPLDPRWSTGGWPNTWQRTGQTWSRSGGYSLSNSALGWYVDGTDNWARLSLDLTGRRDCYLNVWRKQFLGPVFPDLPNDAHDRLTAETSPDGVDWNHNARDAIGTLPEFASRSLDLSQLEGRATGGVRFRLRATAQDTYDGVALDDLTVYCVPPVASYSGADDEFAFSDGTSMAAPHVSGVAALVLSVDPQLTAAALKQQLLASVDLLPSLAGRTVSGGRLNAARAVSLPPRATPAPPGAAPARRRVTIGTALAADVRSIARSLASLRIRKLLRRGRFRVRVTALAAGRFTLKLRTARGTTIARGACARRRAGICTVTARLTPRGRTVLRRARRMDVRVVLAFTPRPGRTVVRRATTTLRR